MEDLRRAAVTYRDDISSNSVPPSASVRSKSHNPHRAGFQTPPAATTGCESRKTHRDPAGNRVTRISRPMWSSHSSSTRTPRTLLDLLHVVQGVEEVNFESDPNPISAQRKVDTFSTGTLFITNSRISSHRLGDTPEPAGSSNSRARTR